MNARRGMRLAAPAVSVASLVAVVWWALHQQGPRWPSSTASLLELLLAVLVYGLVSLVRGVRWWAILRRAHIPVSMRDAQALIVVGYMGNTVLPARGGELLRIFLLGQRSGCSRVTVLGTIIAERLLDVLALLVLLGLLAFVVATGVNLDSLFHIAPAGVAALLAAALALSAGCWWMVRGGRLGALNGRLVSLTLATRNLLSLQGLLLVPLTCAIWFGEGLVYWLVSTALSLHLSILQGCFLVTLSSLVAIIPAAPGYAGTYDAAIQLGLRGMHVQGGPAVAFGLLVRLVIFVPITVVGLIIMVLRYGGLASLGRLRRAGATGVSAPRAAEGTAPAAVAPAFTTVVAPPFTTVVAPPVTAEGVSMLRAPTVRVESSLKLVSK
jgi:uncharacterized membrane protein YbhN (UPF0104 family)